MSKKVAALLKKAKQKQPLPEPAGWAFAGLFIENNDPLAERIRKHGRPLYDHPPKEDIP